MLESVSETFESATMRSDVDAEEMFMQLLDRVESPLGHVWLDGVSVSNKIPKLALLMLLTVASANDFLHRFSVFRVNVCCVVTNYNLPSYIIIQTRHEDRPQSLDATASDQRGRFLELVRPRTYRAEEDESDAGTTMESSTTIRISRVRGRGRS